MRTDQHRPVNFNPEDYAVIDYLDLKQPEYTFGMPIEAYEAMVELWRSRILQYFPDWHTGDDDSDHRGVSTCNHCGYSPIRWACVVRHEPTGANLIFGEICANRVDLPGRDAFRAKFIKDRAALEAAALANAQRKQAFRDANPELIAFLDRMTERDAAWTVAFDALMEEYRIRCQEAEEQGIEWHDRDYPRYPDYQIRRLDGVHPFIQDMIRTLDRKGELTEGQIGAVEKFMANEAKFEARRAEREADDAAHAPTQPLEEGRRVIAGTVLSAEFRETSFGSTPKMLVRQDDGNKVWSTIPEAAFNDPANITEQNPTGIRHIDQLKGRRIEFTGTVERSRDDEHFGFAKRPTKPTVQWNDEGREAS